MRVLAQGTTLSTSTNAEGAFSLSVPARVESLTFSFVGYTSVTQPIAGKTTISVAPAENMITSTEARTDYRRTAQPSIKVSLQSAAPRADKLPTRLLYPQTELNTNAANVPTGITQFIPIFQDPN